MAGRVFKTDGVTPLAAASVYVYHTDEKGYYTPNGNDNRNPRLRGYMRTDAQGHYEFNTIKPGPYPNSRIRQTFITLSRLRVTAIGFLRSSSRATLLSTTECGTKQPMSGAAFRCDGWRKINRARGPAPRTSSSGSDPGYERFQRARHWFPHALKPCGNPQTEESDETILASLDLRFPDRHWPLRHEATLSEIHRFTPLCFFVP